LIQLPLAGKPPMRPEVQKALDTLNRYESLTNAQFDEIVEVECGVPFDDDELISAMIDAGWHYLQHGATWDEDVHYLRVV
jgi:hypothetical protein